MSFCTITPVRVITQRRGGAAWHTQNIGLIRLYSTPRDPLQAEAEAATVRGNRAARARLEAHQRIHDGKQPAQGQGGKFEGKTLAGVSELKWALSESELILPYRYSSVV